MRKARRVGRWMPLGAAAVFLVAGLAGVAGNHITGHVTLALAVFVILIVAGAVITYVLDRKATSRTESDTQEGIVDGREDGTVNLRGAQGVQIGNHNRQQNYFGPDRDA